MIPPAVYDVLKRGVQCLQSDANDRLVRAVHSFSGFTADELEQPHGSAGRTRREVLEEYQQRAEVASRAARWLEGQVRG